MREPQTHAELWDGLQALFGLGGYDESTAVQPYFKVRMIGIGTLRRTMTKRQLSIAQVWTVAGYCAADRSIMVRSLGELLSHTAEAHQAARTVEQGATERTFAARLATALEQEPDPRVRSRLLRVAPDSRERVLTEWEATHD